MILSRDTSTVRPSAPSVATRYLVPAGILLLLASVVLNLVLARRVQSFRQFQEASLTDRLIKVGTAVPPITARRLGGEQEIISYAGLNQPTVLYIFTPPCSWCARNMDNLKTLLDKKEGQYRFVGLSLSEKDLAAYVAKNDLKLPVYSGLSPQMLKTYKLLSTPRTIVISAQGQVLQDWVGAYVGDQKPQIEAFFHVRLPGLRPPESQSAAGGLKTDREAR